MKNKLAVLSRAERRIATIQTIPEVKTTDGELGTLERWARAHNFDLPTRNRIVLTRALVLVRGGELVDGIPKAQGKEGLGLRPTLGRSEVAHSVAQRWQSLTRLGEAKIREAVAMRTDVGQSITLGYLYALARPPVAVEGIPEFPKGPFRTIVIDPPWPMTKIGFDERRPVERRTMDYSVWTLKQIRELPIRKLADTHGAHIYLWVTHRFLPYGLRLFRAWGVRYECVLTWIKPTAQPLWWAHTTEHILFGKVKSLAPVVKGTPTSFRAPQQRHSHKPDEFFDLVRRVSPEGPEGRLRLTMFDEAREGFEPWGVPHR